MNISTLFHQYRLIFIPLVILLTGCGFHLRGNQALPITMTNVQLECAQANNAFCSKLKTSLKESGAEFVDSTYDGAFSIIRVSNFKENKRAVSIGSNAVASEYQLSLSATLDMDYHQATQTIRLVENANISTSQSYRYDDSSVLGKNREEEQVKATLYKQLGFQVIKRMSPFNQSRINQLASKQH